MVAAARQFPRSKPVRWALPSLFSAEQLPILFLFSAAAGERKRCSKVVSKLKACTVRSHAHLRKDGTRLFAKLR